MHAQGVCVSGFFWLTSIAIYGHLMLRTGIVSYYRLTCVCTTEAIEEFVPCGHDTCRSVCNTLYEGLTLTY